MNEIEHQEKNRETMELSIQENTERFATINKSIVMSNEAIRSNIQKIVDEAETIKDQTGNILSLNEDENQKMKQLNKDIQEGRSNLNNKMVELQKLMQLIKVKYSFSNILGRKRVLE